jgi:hypothetical protein
MPASVAGAAAQSQSGQAAYSLKSFYLAPGAAAYMARFKANASLNNQA